MGVGGSCASSVWSLILVCVDEGTGHSTVGRSSWGTSRPWTSRPPARCSVSGRGRRGRPQAGDCSAPLTDIVWARSLGNAPVALWDLDEPTRVEASRGFDPSTRRRQRDSTAPPTLRLTGSHRPDEASQDPVPVWLLASASSTNPAQRLHRLPIPTLQLAHPGAHPT